MPYKDPVARREYAAKWRDKNRHKIKAYTKTWKARHPERVREQACERSKRWREANPAYRRSFTLRKYGLTFTDYEDMLAGQGGGCAICFTRHPGGTSDTFKVDHCHASNRVRGLLCNTCNTAIGLLRDNPIIVRSAAAYLEAR